nr:hypothetical protein [Kofleriaceae bacterium]
MAEPAHVLVVTSAGSAPAAVVPVLAAIEAVGMRVRAIDVGGVGGGGGGMADRVRRALLGEGAERRLRKELELSPPDAAVVFDPHAALALTVVRDQAMNPAPVIGVVAELEPAAAWAQTDCDRFVAIDDIAAVALADAGVEGERVIVVGAIGERAFAEAGAHDRAALRARFKLAAKSALVEVAGMGAEATGQLALQLSLLDGSDSVSYLFDAGSDVEAAAVLRRQVPSLGLKAKLFGATSADAPLLWRAADVIVARPRADVVARAMLVGGKLIALVDDSLAGAATAAAAVEGRRRGLAAKGLLLLSSALDAAFKAGALAGATPTGDGAEHVADIVAVVAGDKRAIIDERRLAAHAATRDRVRAASAAASVVAATAAMPGELEDLGGGGGGAAAAADDAAGSMPDAQELARLRTEVKQRVVELTRAMNAARDASAKLGDDAKAATAAGKLDDAAALDKRADAERARMHALLGELASLESELAELERVSKVAADAPKVPPRATVRGDDLSDLDDLGPPPPRAAPRVSVDDALAELKRRAGGGGGPPPAAASASKPSGAPPSSGAKPASSSKRTTNVEDELAALKRKMAAAPPKPKK